MNGQSFRKAYQAAADEILPMITPEIQDRMARHNPQWRSETLDFGNYIRASWIRYWTAFKGLNRLEPPILQADICDVGGFLGIFPLTLRKMGFQSVAMTEALTYYDGCLDQIIKKLESGGVRVIDFDPFSENSSPVRKADFITCMAILEHYPHSPRQFMNQVRSMAREGGLIHIEIPNMAYFPKRMALLLGRTPLVPIEDFYNAEIPFTGHHHEYTAREIRDLARLSGLEEISLESYTYSLTDLESPRFILRHPLLYLSQKFFPNTREVLAILSRKPTATQEA